MTSTDVPLVAPHAAFSVLAVCTGNICRSPAVERLLRTSLADPGVEVTSAGTGALVGYPVSPPMLALLAAAGVAADDFLARQLTEEMVRRADLVLALTRAHRAAVVELVPAAVRRTFTLREFARLSAGVDPTALPGGAPPVRLRALVQLAAAQRGRLPVRPTDDDVIDPYRRSDEVYAQVFTTLRASVDEVVGLARG